MPFPATGVATFTTKVDFRDVIFAEHVNTLQSELRSTQLALNPSFLSSIYNESYNSTTKLPKWVNTASWPDLHERLNNIERGLMNKSDESGIGLPYFRKAGGALDDTTASVSLITKSAVSNTTIDQIQTKTSAGVNGFTVNWNAVPNYQGFRILDTRDSAAIYTYIDNLDIPVPEAVESGFNPFLLAGM